MTFRLNRCSATACMTIAALSACTGLPSAPAGTAQSFQQRASASSYQLLYRFRTFSHGMNPRAALIHVKGTLYGTTPYGGSGTCGIVGCGTVFALSTDGSAKVLYNFAGGSGGAFPKGRLLDINGTLYGATTSGGDSGCPNGPSGNGCGIVYSLTLNGSETILHRFHGGSDGANPSGGLVELNGTLYGTTINGGAQGCGTVYSIQTSGLEKVVADFCTRRLAGLNPEGELVAVNGALYGTTSGANGTSGCRLGCGSVFRVDANGAGKVLHNFTGGQSDGANPYAGLVNVNGTLYGTTTGGGDGYGTVYGISTTGSENVLYRFNAPPDGDYPVAPLTVVNGVLYGTTVDGGIASGCHKGRSCGTVFSVDMGGKERVVHRFAGGSADGANPYAGLTTMNGRFYGTTSGGGMHCDVHRCGTVFALSL